MTMRHGDGEEARVTMCIVIDYADPSSENPFLEGGGGVGGWRSVKQGDGWIAREKENGEESAKSARRDPPPPHPNKKSPLLTLPTLSAKEEERKGNRGGGF